MMDQIAIRAEKLSKQYRIGARQERYRTLRDTLADAFANPFVQLHSVLARSGNGSGNGNNTIWALKDVSFEVQRGEVVGIIGHNGAGKSTLLRILSRITEPTLGRAEIHGCVSSLLEVGTGFHAELTGRENVYLNGAILGMKRAEVLRQLDAIVAFAEVERFIDTPVKHYSSGMYLRLAFAVAAHLETDVLLVDEVLAVGDAAFQKKCLGKMDEVAKQGRTVLFVSHNMGAVSNLCSKGVVLDSGRVVFESASDEALQFYSRAVLGKNGGPDTGSAHIIYAAPPDNGSKEDLAITKIEVIDTAGRPKLTVATWDDLVFRIWYRSRRFVRRGSVVLRVAGMDGSRLILLSNEPDGTLPLPLQVGEHSVDCVIEKLPLASGDYFVGAGLAMPNTEWLWWRPELGTLTVISRDVYGSGMAPKATRALLAIQHSWRLSS